MKILLILIILGVIIFSIWSAKRKGITAKVKQAVTQIETEPDEPLDFGYKSNWIAVKGNNCNRIAEIIGFRQLQEANWNSGMKKAFENGIYLTPQISEWTLVRGMGIPFGDSPESIEKLEIILNQLSKEFGEAQFFGTHRVVEFHNWMKSVDGQIKRIYSYLGESMENIKIEGEPTSLESKLNLFNSFSEESKLDGYHDKVDLVFPNEELVIQIAEEWSVNPTEISERSDIKNKTGYFAN